MERTSFYRALDKTIQVSSCEYPYIHQHNNTQGGTKGQKAHGNLPLPLNQDQIAAVVKFPHSLALLELLPLLDQFSSLAQALNLITLSVRYPFRSEDVQLWPHLARPAPMFHAVVNQCCRPGVPVGNTPGSFHVGQQIFLCLRGFALEVMSLPPHFTCLGTNHFKSRTVTDFRSADGPSRMPTLKTQPPLLVHPSPFSRGGSFDRLDAGREFCVG